MNVRMQAIKGFPYAGKRLNPGDQFEARGERDARLLVAIGKARRASDIPVASVAPRALVIKPAAVATSTVVAEVANLFPGGSEPEQKPAEAEQQGAESGQPAGEARQEGAEAQQPAPKAKRQYKRRDMTAEGRE